MDLNFHFIHRVRSQAKTLANRTALRYFKDNNWLDISWAELQQQIDQISLALLANHIDIQDKIGIFAHNMPRWTITDIGTLQVRAVTVPIYATNTAKQAQFIINNADMKIIFVGDQEQYDQVIDIADECPTLQKIVAMKNTIHLHEHAKACHWQEFIDMADEQYQAELQQRLDGKCLEDLFTLIYTSGTTGEPKGVMLDYANLAHQLKAHDQALKVDDSDVSLSFLPLSHIFERAWVAYVLHRGATNCYIEDTNQVRSALTEIRPTLMCAVPRFYEKNLHGNFRQSAQRTKITSMDFPLGDGHRTSTFRCPCKRTKNWFSVKTTIFPRQQTGTWQIARSTRWAHSHDAMWRRQIGTDYRLVFPQHWIEH